MTLPRGISRLSDAVVNSSSAPEVLYMGVGALNTGAVCTTTSAPVYTSNGIPVTASGQVCVTAVPTPPLYSSGGLLYDSTGRLNAVDLGAAIWPLNFSNSFLMDSTGSIVLTLGGGGFVETKGRMTFDAAAQGSISVTGGFSYTGFAGSSLVGATRALNTTNIEGGTSGTSADLGTVMWVGDTTTLTFNFPAGFRKFSFCYATHAPLSLEFYDGGTKVFEVSSVGIPQTILGTNPTFDDWNSKSVSFPTTATSAVFTGTAFQYIVDSVTCGKLDPLGIL